MPLSRAYVCFLFHKNYLTELKSLNVITWTSAGSESYRRIAGCFFPTGPWWTAWFQLSPADYHSSNHHSSNIVSTLTNSKCNALATNCLLVLLSLITKRHLKKTPKNLCLSLEASYCHTKEKWRPNHSWASCTSGLNQLWFTQAKDFLLEKTVWMKYNAGIRLHKQ